MSTPTLDAAKEAKDEANQGNLRENDAGIPDELNVDYEEHSPVDVSGHAEALITFDHIARISIQQYGNDENLLDLEQNLEGAGQYGYDLEITLANPEVVEGQIWKETDVENEEWAGYKVIGDPNDDSNNHEIREEVQRDSDGNVTGAETKGINISATSSWDGEQVDEFGDDYITVNVASRRAADVLGSLDTAGQWFTTKEGEVVEGILETPPNFGTDVYDAEEDGRPRLVGYPELRADMVGQSGAISFTNGDGGSNGNAPKEVDVYKLDDGNLEALVPLQPDDEAYNLPTYPRVNGRYWDDDAGDGSVEADAEPETTEGVAEAQQMMSDDDGQSEPDVVYTDLTDDAQDFVNDALQAMGAKGYESVTEFGDFEERVQTVRADGEIQTDADDLATIIDRRATDDGETAEVSA